MTDYQNQISFSKEHLELLEQLAFDEVERRTAWDITTRENKTGLATAHQLLAKILLEQAVFQERSEIMAADQKRWSSLLDVCTQLEKHPVSFSSKLKKLREDGYLKPGIHYRHTGEHKTSQIQWDCDALTKYFRDFQNH